MNTNANAPAPANTRTVIESNYMGGRWIDRVYQLGVIEGVVLINKDSTRYNGKIYRRRITLQNSQGENFFSVAYESADGRWFGNSGMPIDKPKTFEKEDEKDKS